MVVVSCHRSSSDHSTLVQLVRGVFARSPIFREAVISEPLSGPDGEAIVDVSFGHGRTAFRVIASTEDDAYAILCDLAFAVGEDDHSHRVV